MSLLQSLQDFTASAKSKMAQYNNANFKNATMAVCALIAAADGDIEAEEKTKVAKLIGSNELLQAFNATELRETFLSYCDKATDEFSRLDLLNLDRSLRTKPRLRPLSRATLIPT
jgi:tellurite resistance protein TerB